MLTMLEKITLSLENWKDPPSSFLSACKLPSRPTTCFPSDGVWFQKIINSRDLILPCHNRLCFTRKGGVLTYQMKVKYKTTFYLCHVSKLDSTWPWVLGVCGLPLSCGFMHLEKVSNININLTKGMETFIIKRVKHIFDV